MGQQTLGRQRGLSLIGFIIVAGLTLGGGNDGGNVPVVPGVAGFFAALVAALWAYDGWNNVSMVSSEIRNPQRNLPLSQSYTYDGYDDRRFFGKRRRTHADEEIAARRVDAERADAARLDAERLEAERAAAQRDARERELRDRDVRDRDVRDVRGRDDEISVPVDREDAVTLKRGEDGRDEIIIRRPKGEARP